MLILSDGDLPSLLATACNVDERPSLLLVGDESRRAALATQADLYDLSIVQGRMGSGFETPRLTNRTLLEAANTAAERELGKVVWPAHAGPEIDLDRVSSAVDRALLISRLIGLDHPEVSIETPFVDLCDHQIADLVVDMALPVQLCWWWDVSECGAREQWMRVLEEANWIVSSLA